jgi:phosphatidate phosphatase PAH1
VNHNKELQITVESWKKISLVWTKVTKGLKITKEIMERLDLKSGKKNLKKKKS